MCSPNRIEARQIDLVILCRAVSDLTKWPICNKNDLAPGLPRRRLRPLHSPRPQPTCMLNNLSSSPISFYRPASPPAPRAAIEPDTATTSCHHERYAIVSLLPSIIYPPQYYSSCSCYCHHGGRRWQYCLVHVHRSRGRTNSQWCNSYLRACQNYSTPGILASQYH